MVRVSIVGSAGRGADAHKWTPALYRTALDKVSELLLNEVGDLGELTLVSGGAAWADHIALDLALVHPVAGLELHLPCDFRLGECRFHDTGEADSKANPGSSANRYHREFSAKCGTDSLRELHACISSGVPFVKIYPGFHSRNAAVAKTDVMVALTFGRDGPPLGSGTLDTWKMCTGRRFHISLLDLS